MTVKEAVKHLENLKWLKGYSNTTVDGVPIGNVIDGIIALLKEQEPRVMAGAELTDAELIEEIRKAPIVLKPNVNAAQVVHARWIGYPECLGYDGAYSEDHIVCSNCKSVWSIIDNDTERFKHCPNCGAKMDGERRDDDAAD